MIKANHNHRDKGIRRDAKIGDHLDNNTKPPGRLVTIRRVIPIVAVLSIGTSIYGFQLGKKSGYLNGVNAGYVKGGQELIASWREHSEQIRLSRETR